MTGDVVRFLTLMLPGFAVGFLFASGPGRVGGGAFALAAIGLPAALWVCGDLSVGWIVGAKLWLAATAASGLVVGYVSRCRARDAGLPGAAGLAGIVPVANVALALAPSSVLPEQESIR